MVNEPLGFEPFKFYCMGIVAILVNGQQPFQQSFIPLPQEGSTWNLRYTGPEALEEKSFEIINIFSIQMYGAHTNAYRSKFDLTLKGQTSMYDHHFTNFGRPPVRDDLCKDLAPRHPLFWRRRLLTVFTIYGHGGHLGQWIPSISAIFHSPAPKRILIKFEQH